MTGAHDQAHAAFCTAADLAEPDDPGTAMEMLLDATFTAMLTAGPVQALPLASRARSWPAHWPPGSESGRTRTGARSPCNPAPRPASRRPSPLLPGWLAAGRAPRRRAVPDQRLRLQRTAHQRLADADRAFAEVRATADRANDPLAMAMLAISHGYTLTRMGRLDEALAASDSAAPCSSSSR